MFILPVYREENIIIETLNHFYEHILKNDNIELVIVGTTRERMYNGINKTLDLCFSEIKGKSKIHVIEAKTEGYMAHQINYAIDYIKNNLGCSLNNTRVHMINIDSRISQKSINEIFYKINKGIKILLQSTIFTLNFNKIGLFGKGASIYQSRWTILEEQYRILFNKYISSYKLFHIVGHGLIINLSKLLEYKKLPEDTINEDLHFGFYLAVRKEPIELINSYEIGDMPNSISERFKQTLGRFIGVLEYYRYPLSYIRKFGKKWNLRLLIFTIQGYFNIIKRFFGSYLLIFLIIFPLFINFNRINLILGISSVLIYRYHYYLIKNYLYRCNFIKNNKFYYFLSSIFISLIESIPLTVGFIKYVLYKLGLIEFYKNKTSHE